jgi:hypothetical protein
LKDDECASADHVTKRYKENEAESVSALRSCDDAPEAGNRDVEVASNEVEHRLRQVDVCDA